MADEPMNALRTQMSLSTMRFMRLFALIAALFRGAISVYQARGDETADLIYWKKSVRSRFPTVQQLSTEALSGWFADTNRPVPLLLDVRTEAEFAMSHLPKARRVEPGSDPVRLAAELPTNRPVVVYCSVGWRSSELAERLRKAGVTNVINLEGSIFAWANEGRPLETDGKSSAVVHPYNSTFSKLLKPERRGKL